MKSLDKNYLSLQFRDRVHRKNAAEFQSFFEDIMGMAFKDFQKIRPYGNQGDRGNDGYLPNKGVYYQAYSPLDPEEKEAKAAQKFKDNFYTLKANWDQISKIKEYNFVFNDKYTGVTIKLEKAKAELKKENPEIDFKLFLPKDLEDTFFSLDIDQLISLGFDVDSRNALQNARDFLEKLEVELDRGNAGFVLKAVESIKSIVEGQNEEALTLDYEIVECKALVKVEKVDEAREKYENIFKRYPKDPRAPLLLAEIYLNNEDNEKNQELLQKAESIDPAYWLLQLEKLVREYRFGSVIDASQIDEAKFPNNSRQKAAYYRIYSLFLEMSGDQQRADSFIERSIQLNPERFDAYYVKLSFRLEGLLSENKERELISEGEQFLQELEDVRQNFKSFGGPGIRNDILLNTKKLRLLLFQDNYPEIVSVTKDTFELVLKCFFDQTIDKVLLELLTYVVLPQEQLSVLANYLLAANKSISDDLGKAMLMQFMKHDTLTTEGTEFFQKAKKDNLLKFIGDLVSEDHDKVLTFIKDDIRFAVGLFELAKSYPQLRRKIMDGLPNDGTVQKEKLLLLLNYEEGEIDEAYSILKGLDLSGLSYSQCATALQVAEKKKAWDFATDLLEKLLSYEKDERNALQIKLKLFSANINLEKYIEAIRIGEAILANAKEIELLDDQNKESLLAQAISASYRRGQHDNALELVKQYGQFLKTFEGKLSAAEIYLKNNDPDNALSSVVEAIKIVKRPSAEQYGSLFLIFTQIVNLKDFPLVSEKEVVPGSYVKLKDDDRWFYIGDEDELDAIKIPDSGSGRAIFLNKKPGEKVVFERKYGSEKNEREIEIILPIEKYILWQCTHNAQRLSVDGLWDKMEVIEVPTTELGIDPKYLKARLEDEHTKGQEFFKTYCENNIPLTLLAVSEGGLTQAIGRIVHENKGFIKANTGTLKEMDEQKELARQIIAGQPFYIDGTSALFLSESGLLEKIHKFLPNMKVPQSVITLLLELTEKLRYTPGLAGHMGYAQGKITISTADPKKQEVFQKRFENGLRILESESKGVEAISLANKSGEFSETRVPPSLSDACILAQRDGAIVLTEDFMYLQLNALETEKSVPKYCSTLALISVLYEQQKISFEEYLNFFAYLSSYRFRFLPITVVDLEKALLGDGIIKRVKVEELRKFNFPLTLAEEYGVPVQTATILVGQFLIKLLIDDSILPGIVERVFAEIVSSFPTTQNKKVFGRSLLTVCVQAINKNQNKIIAGRRIQEKIDLLSQLIKIMSSDKIIVP